MLPVYPSIDTPEIRRLLTCWPWKCILASVTWHPRGNLVWWSERPQVWGLSLALPCPALPCPALVKLPPGLQPLCLQIRVHPAAGSLLVTT